MNFNETDEFSKNFKRLSKKYRSLPDDLLEFKKVVSELPLGSGKHFVILHNSEQVKIMKARLFCRYLRGASLRIIYAYQETKEMLEKMKKAGCYMIRYGVESSSQEILNKVRKGITIAQVIEAFKITQKIGIETHASYVLGLPGETKKTMEETIKFAIKLGGDYAQFAAATPYPGTELYQEAKERGWLKINNWSDFEVSENCVLEYPDLKAGEIVEACKRAYKRFYFRPDYMLKRILKIRSLAELFQLIKGGISLIKRSFFRR